MLLHFKRLYLLVVVACCMACNDDLQLQQVSNERDLVVIAQAERFGAFSLQLKRSDLITQDTQSTPISNAKVELFRNGRLLEVKKSSAKGDVVFEHVPKADDTLLIQITGDELDPVWTETIVPSDVEIEFFNVDTTIERTDYKGFNVIFNDDPLSTDYYLIDLKGYRWVYRFHVVTGVIIDSAYVSQSLRMNSINGLFFSDNNIVNNRQNFELFNDRFFNGKQRFKLDFDVNTFVLSEQPDKSAIDKVEVTLKHISKEYYDFLTTLSLNRPVYGGPFSISSQVPSNVHGGYGIFIAFSQDTSSIDLE